MSATIAERVAAGAAFLDQHDPDWWREDVERAINLNTLELRSMDSCVLGQRCPVSVLAAHIGVTVAGELEALDWIESYRAYGKHLSGVTDHLGLQEWAQGLGFNAHGGEGEHEEFRVLTTEWKRVIRERRGAA